MTTCYTNGRIFTADGRKAECFVVCEGKFAYVGSAKEARMLFPDAQFVDLHDQFVCPGFNDSHMHLLNLGNMLNQAQLSPATDSLRNVLDTLEAYVAQHTEDAWILGRGWNQDYFTDTPRYPSRDDLDAICPDKPCLITRACGHVAVANSRALALAGIDLTAPVIDGGRVVTDENGRPNGVLEENALELINDVIPVPDRAQLKKTLLRGMEHVNRFGITSVQSDDFSSTKAPFEEVIAAYLELKAEGRMTVRVTEQCWLPDKETLQRFLDQGYSTGWGDEWFRIGPLKLICDGSLGSRTALMLEPYADAPETCGIAPYSQEALNELCDIAHSNGMQIAAHAIGDGAAELVLNAIEYAQSCHPREDARHGIVHAQILNHAQAQRMKALNMHAYIQSIFLDYDTKIVYPRIGKRADEAYPAASLLRLGATISGGSDSPVEPPDVMTGIQCAVTRKPVTREAQQAYLPHEALTLSQALLCFTAYGAYASFETEIKGKICGGMLADFTVLGIDPFETDPKFLHRIPIRQTYLAGKPV
ncbi:MAG: amidohydrolase [Clostridia bacterium]|nr:amidohydrolase [Clostridia bacterium]